MSFEQRMAVGLLDWASKCPHANRPTSMEVGRLACGHLLAQSKRPTAILCSNDMTAIGVMRKCYEDGIAIPRDLSVVGFDDIRLAQFMLPPLTTVEMSQAELARLAFDALLAEVERAEPLPRIGICVEDRAD